MLNTQDQKVNCSTEMETIRKIMEILTKMKQPPWKEKKKKKSTAEERISELNNR